jgi:hypothetical protein
MKLSTEDIEFAIGATVLALINIIGLVGLLAIGLTRG